MSLLNYQILQDSCSSIIAEQTAAILVEEFGNQNDNYTPVSALPNKVYFNYIKAIDAGEYPMVGVMLMGTVKDSGFQNQKQITSTYAIEVKVNGATELRRLTEVTRHILESSCYNKLNLSDDFGIRNTTVETIDYNIFENRQSSGEFNTAYITFKVSHFEYTDAVGSIPLLQTNTTAIRNNDKLYYSNTNLN